MKTLSESFFLRKEYINILSYRVKPILALGHCACNNHMEHPAVEVSDAAEAEERHNKESAAGAEVADINADHGHAEDEPEVRAAAAAAGGQPTAQRPTQDKHDGGEEQQPGQQE